MTFRRRITLIVFVIIIVSILVTSAITSGFINSYFKGYLEEVYRENIDNLIEESAQMIKFGGNEHQLEKYLNEPITDISIYYISGDLMYYESSMPNHRGRMNMPMMFSGETDQFDIIDGGEKIGTLVVERSSQIQNSETMALFNFALFRGTFAAAVIALILSMLLSRGLSKGITSDLKETAKFANSIDLEEEPLPKVSRTIEIRSIQRQLVNLSKKLKLHSRARKAKVDQIAHETKTPITILKSQLEGAADGILDMDEKRLKSCLDAVGRLEKLTGDITKVLEVEVDEVEASHESFDLMGLLKTIKTGLSIQFEEKGIDLTLSGPEQVMVSTDKNLLSQSLYNLMINALKFTEQGAVEIRVNVDGPIKIKIIDTGIGIANEHLEKIFEPYYRGVSNEAFHGDGLGLYIVMRNINAIGAKITVYSQLGNGTQFEVTL